MKNMILLLVCAIFVGCGINGVSSKESLVDKITIYIEYINTTANGDLYVYVDDDLEAWLPGFLGHVKDTLLVNDGAKIKGTFRTEDAPFIASVEYVATDKATFKFGK